MRLLGKLFFLLNILAALLLAVSFIVPYLAPSEYPTLSLLSLAVSPLLLLNCFFALYWLLNLNKRFLLSTLLLIVAYFHFSPFFMFSSEGDSDAYSNSMSVLSFNVRLFNLYEKELDSIAVRDAIAELLNDKSPDVVLVQEYFENPPADFSAYPYQFIHFKGENKLGHAIFSKYPLKNMGAFDFKKTYNNSIYADVIVNQDTLRLYNLHLQSLGILPSVDFIQQRGTDQIRVKISESFINQESQVSTIQEHQSRSPYPVIMGGDFNNTSFSYIYRKLKNNMLDAFHEGGNGIGTTYFFNKYPMRIDFMLTSESFEVLNFEVADRIFSDHNPIIMQLAWE